jgi:hypothetical protein
MIASLIHGLVLKWASKPEEEPGERGGWKLEGVPCAQHDAKLL